MHSKKYQKAVLLLVLSYVVVGIVLALIDGGRSWRQYPIWEFFLSTVAGFALVMFLIRYQPSVRRWIITVLVIGVSLVGNVSAQMLEQVTSPKIFSEAEMFKLCGAFFVLGGCVAFIVQALATPVIRSILAKHEAQAAEQYKPD